MNENVLILTCTVSPQTKISVNRNDMQLRESDYRNAIKFYLTKLNSNFDIIVVENSNSIRLLETDFISDNRVKFVQAPIDNISSFSGKSAGELRMLQFLIDKGYLNTYKYVWKVTGRIVVRNINALTREFQGDICAYRYKDSHSCDTKFFGMKLEVFKEFANTNVNFDESSVGEFHVSSNTFHSIENYLALFCVKMSEQRMKISAPTLMPFYQGYSASSGKKLNSFKFYISYIYSRIFRNILLKALGSHLP